MKPNVRHTETIDPFTDKFHFYDFTTSQEKITTGRMRPNVRHTETVDPFTVPRHLHFLLIVECISEGEKWEKSFHFAYAINQINNT